MKISLKLVIVLSLGVFNWSQEARWQIWDKFVNQINIFNDFLPTTTTNVPQFTPTVRTRLVSVEETVFQISSKLQKLFNPGDNQAKINYIICPLSVVNMLGQLLIGTYGTYNKYVLNLLGLSPQRPKRDVQFYQLTKDQLYDKKLYHSAFHWKLRGLVNKIKRNKNYTAKFQNELMYNQAYEVVEHFKKYAEDFYQTDLLAVDLMHPDTRVISELAYFKNKNRIAAIGQFLHGGIQDPVAIIISRFEFKSTWETPLSEGKKKEIFTVKPYEDVKVTYLQGTIKNALYVDNAKFTLAAIPLKLEEAKMYVLLPKDEDVHIRKFSESLKNFDFFNSIEENYSNSLQNINIKIPKMFPYETELDILNPILDDLGEQQGKNQSYINLNRASKEIKLLSLIQHMSISISNEKSQLSLVRLFTKPMTIQQSVDFKIVRPFLFFIRHTKTKMILVWGSVSDPSLLHT